MRFKNRGVLGLEISRTVIVTLLVLAVTAIAVFLALVTLQTSTNSLFTSSAAVSNESLTSVDNVTGETVTNAGLSQFAMGTSPTCYNATNGAVIPAANLSATSAGVIKSTSTNCAADPAGFCNYNWNCSYSYTYLSNTDATTLVGNVTTGTTTFFSYVPTWMVLLAVVVLIAIVGLIIMAVSRFDRGQKGGL